MNAAILTRWMPGNKARLIRTRPRVSTHATASSEYGIRSDVAWARAPLPEAAMAWPAAQARLPSPKASPWSSRWCWAPSLTSVMAGVNSVPKHGMPRISAGMSAHADASVGASRLIATAPVSEHLIGTMGPSRSAARPATGDSAASTPAAARNVPAMIRAVTPRFASRSGASTSSTPNARPASIVSHSPMPSRRSPIAVNASRSPCGTASRGAGTANAAAISSPPATAALANAGPVPTTSAIAPTTGPNSAPPTAAPMAVPIISPRRSGGASVASQAMPPAQVHAPPTPCTNRAE